MKHESHILLPAALRVLSEPCSQSITLSEDEAPCSCKLGREQPGSVKFRNDFQSSSLRGLFGIFACHSGAP